MRYAKIDKAGLFIEDVLSDKPAENLISMPCPAGLYWPKWDGQKWIEGKTAAEITTHQEAKAVVASFEANQRSIEDYFKTAIQTDKDYLAVVAPTANQKEIQLNKLSRQNIRIMRYLLKQFDEVE